MSLTIQERIKDLRVECRLTLKELAKQTGLSEMRNHPNADLADLRLSDGMIEVLKNGQIDNALLCELVAHPDFVKLLADIQIYVEGIAAM